MSAPPDALARAGTPAETIAALQRPDASAIARDLHWLAEPGHDRICWDSDRYPALLREISAPPPALYTVGDAELLWQPQMAVVGSRNPTAGGYENARAFSRALVAAGLAITSGMALGIDGAAHVAALDAGGRTIAVLGTGPDRVYPQRNRALAGRIRANGLLVTELPPGTGPRREHFPSRNRIISGLGLGVLVVEAALGSGSLITARLAAEQGREVFAIPGSIHNPLARGCHQLIRDGARLVETATDVLRELAPLAGCLARALEPDSLAAGNPGVVAGTTGPQEGMDPEYRRLWACLGYDPLPADTLVRRSGLTTRVVSAMLLLLELQGRVEAHPGGAFSRKTRGR